MFLSSFVDRLPPAHAAPLLQLISPASPERCAPLLDEVGSIHNIANINLYVSGRILMYIVHIKIFKISYNLKRSRQFINNRLKKLTIELVAAGLAAGATYRFVELAATTQVFFFGNFTWI
jgi:hypothetical protein